MDFMLATSMPIGESRIGCQEVKAVSARALYRNLGLNASQWARWSASNIQENPFASEHEDWVGFDIMSSGNPTRDFFLAVPFAKKLAMQVRTAEGERVRTYFLECERRAHAEDLPGPVQVLLTATRTDILRMALNLSEERDALKVQTVQQQAAIATLVPKAEALDRISNAEGNHCITDAAKVLKMRPTDLFDWLSKRNWIYRRPGGGAWIAYQDRIDGGWLVNKVLTLPGKVLLEGGKRVTLPEKVVDRLLVTPKGLAHLSQLLAKGA
jgi:anti-repressor protein